MWYNPELLKSTHVESGPTFKEDDKVIPSKIVLLKEDYGLLFDNGIVKKIEFSEFDRFSMGVGYWLDDFRLPVYPSRREFLRVVMINWNCPYIEEVQFIRVEKKSPAIVNTWKDPTVQILKKHWGASGAYDKDIALMLELKREWKL